MARRNFIDWNGSGRLDPQDLVTGVAMDTVEAKKSTFSDEEIIFIQREMEKYVNRGLGLIDIEMHKFDLNRTRYKLKQEFLYDLLLKVANSKPNDEEAKQNVSSVIASYSERFEM